MQKILPMSITAQAGEHFHIMNVEEDAVA